MNLKKFGLKSSIKESIVDFEIHELTFEVNCSIGDKRFNEDLESNIYRIFQECVNNVIKHAQANHVKVSLFILEKKLVLIIEDNGKGIMVLPSHSGNGLSNILFRVQHMKGTIDIISKSNIGTKTTINIPL